MADFRAAFKKLKSSVVGIGIRNDPDYQILGTGFIIDSNGLIATNRHVIEAISDMTLEGDIRVKQGAAAFLFVQAASTPEFRAVIGFTVMNIGLVAIPPNADDENKELDAKIERGEIVPPKYKEREPEQIIHPGTLDIGVCMVDPRELPPEVLPLSSVKIIHSKSVSEGMTVGVIGFPQGLLVPGRYSTLSQIQMTPLLQVGVVSAMLPMSGDPKPDNFVLDIMINPGSSGSPVFLDNGNVIGIVYATRVAFHPMKTLHDDGILSDSESIGVSIPSGLGLAIPSARFPEEWFGHGERARRI